MALSVAPPGPHLVPPVARAASSGSRAPARGALGGAPGQLLLGVCGFSICGALRRSSARSAVQRRARLEKRVIQESPYLDEKPYEGDLVRIHYVGRLSDGTCFDNSRVRGKPFEFVMGESEVIDGWEILISTMALKEKAELTCPPQYAYGDDGVPPYVPPGETVTFTVDLLDIGRPVQEEEKPVVDVSEDEEDEDENFWDKDEQREKGRCLGFNWEASGSGQEIFVRVPLSDDVRVKEIKVNITSTAIKCKIADQMVIEGTLFAPVLTDDSFWDFEKKGKKVFLLITLGKMDASIKWDSLLEGGDPVATSSAPAVEVVDVEEAKAKRAKTVEAPKLTEMLENQLPQLQMSFRGNETVPEALNRVRPEMVVVRSSKLQEKDIDAAEEGCGALRMVMRAGAGVDNLALPVLRERGIQVANAQDANATAVAELTFAHLLNLDRRLSDQVESLRRGEWQRLDFAKGPKGLFGRNLAVLGVGNIGREVIRRAVAFGMQVRAWSRSFTPQEARELNVEFCTTPAEAVDGADALCVHLALAQNTRNLVDRSLLWKLKPGALVVNMSRGGVVDEAALLDAVEAHGIRAGLDVYAKEPGANGTEFEDAAIMNCSGVYGSHHTGARTEQAAIAVETAVLRVVSAYLEGRPIPGLL